MIDWPLIESAPRDGSRVLLWPHQMTGWWEVGDEAWMLLSIPLNEDHTILDDWSQGSSLARCIYADDLGVEPTHWMPLPPPPEAGNAPIGDAQG